MPALAVRSDRRVTVLATRDGEFVILDQESVTSDSVDLETLSGMKGGGATSIWRDPIPDLLDVPRAASPSGP